MDSLIDRYRHKIKTPAEIREIIGAPPRARRVIMCHGVFDVVHPDDTRSRLIEALDVLRGAREYAR